MMMCGGLYPWLVYRNQGNGVFPDTAHAEIKYQPVPLESDTGNSSIVGGVASVDHGVLDIDGDGYPDSIIRAKWTNEPPWWWFIWHGNRNGGFDPQTYLFENRDHTPVYETGTSGNVIGSTVGLLDINSDGLPDHWKVGEFGNANVALNNGTGFRLLGMPSGSSERSIGEVATPINSSLVGVKPGEDAVIDEASHETGSSSTSWITAGKRHAHNRTLDVDGDGRVDIVSYRGTDPTPKVFFNQGGNFQTDGVDYPGDYGGMRQVMIASGGGPAIDPAYTWELTQDLVDLDGDGIAESYYWADANTMVGAPASFGTSPPRLLKSIENGRGNTTTVAYSSMQDPNAVEQHPEAGKSSGEARWVVKSLTVQDVIAATSSSTVYRYINPRVMKDDQGRYGFRGFDEVKTMGPSGAMKVERYGYSPDWSGRLVTNLTLPTAQTTEVRSIDETTWEERLLFDGAIKTYHAMMADHSTCRNGQAEVACRANTDTRTRSVTYLSAKFSTTAPGSGPVLLWHVTGSRLQTSATPGDGDRTTATTYALNSDASTYRLRSMETRNEVQVAGVATLYAKQAQTWDATYRVPLTDEVWFTAVDAERAITRREYDMATGNVLSRWKPKQNAANTTNLSNTYDARKLFVVTDVDEKDLQRDHSYDYGTGAKVMSQGPNVRSCVNDPTTCPSDATHPIKEQVQDVIDGLGRPIERWETVSSDGFLYLFMKISTTTYVDAIAPTNVPTSVVTEKLLHASSSVWVKEKTELDGHGRPIRQTSYAQGTAPADAITTYHYRNDGTLQDVNVPDPSANDATTVQFTYSFDSLGRPTGIRRPDAVNLIDRSGVDMVYDGVTSTTSEVVGAAGGNIAVTKTTHDAFGRLKTVDERTNATAWATTTYTYAADNNVAQIVDPQGVTTNLTHDIAGHRTKIMRGGRTWIYTYDLNGNPSTEQVPGSPDEMHDLDYTTSTAYDDLDRPSSRLNGPRNLSIPDRELFGADIEVFRWDFPNNRKGRLSTWQSFATGSATPAVSHVFQYNTQGAETAATQTFAGPGLPVLTRDFLARKTLLGGPFDYRYFDQVGGTNNTTSVPNYDAAGRLRSFSLMRGGEPIKQIAVQTRNVAGLVTKRRTDQTGAMTFIESNWTYDKLGRVTSQVVLSDLSDPVVRQDLVYNGNDDPKTLHHYLGSNHKQFDFGYDLRHQLKQVDEVTTLGYFSAQYSYGSAGRLTSAMETILASPPPGSEVLPRNVTYQYGDSDPERVTALVNVVGGQPLRTYTYDDAGNQTTRCNGVITAGVCAGESVDYVYDGRDQLRRVTKKLNGAVQGYEEYWYDGKGMRITTLRRDAAGLKTELVWVIGDVEAHYDGGGIITHVYSHLSLGTPVARIDRTSNTATNVEFQFHGLANHTLAAVDQGGTINASFSYAPFGEVIEATNAGGAPAGTAAHRRRNNDKYVDEVSGLSYYGARYYDNVLLGWTQCDPLSRFAPDAAWVEPRRANLYTNDLNNPLRYLDPDGRMPGTGAMANGPMVVPVAAAGTGVLAGIGAALAVASLPVLAVVAAVVVVVTVATDKDLAVKIGGYVVGMNGVMEMMKETIANIPRPIYSTPKDTTGTGTGSGETTGTGEGSAGDGSESSRTNPPLNDPRYRLPSDKSKPDQIPSGRKIPKGAREKFWDLLRPKKSVVAPAKSDRHLPADYNHDGEVSNDEMSEWSRRQQ